jgi:hypothetical protein
MTDVSNNPADDHADLGLSLAATLGGRASDDGATKLRRPDRADPSNPADLAVSLEAAST